MNNDKVIELLTESYAKYNLVVKILLADVEAKWEALPEQILNEIRAYNDHIARCFVKDTSQEQIEDEIEKASGHLTRTELDCFKLLNVYQKKQIERFEKKNRRVNLNSVNDGLFIVEYHRIYKEVRKTIKEAKLKESYEKQVSLELFEKGYNLYSELVELIQKNRRGITHARVKYWLSLPVTFVGWILTVAATGTLGGLVGFYIRQAQEAVADGTSNNVLQYLLGLFN